MQTLLHGTRQAAADMLCGAAETGPLLSAHTRQAALTSTTWRDRMIAAWERRENAMGLGRGGGAKQETINCIVVNDL